MNLVTDDIICGRSNHIELTPLGRNQAKALGRFLVARGYNGIDAWASSPAVRAIGTGEIALRTINQYQKPTLDPRIQEMSQGQCEGANRSEIYIPEVVDRIHREQKDFRLPGGESINDVAKRAQEALEEWAITAPADTTTLWTAHGFFKRCLLAHRENLSHTEMRKMHTPNCCLTIVTEHNGKIDIPEFAIDTNDY